MIFTDENRSKFKAEVHCITSIEEVKRKLCELIDVVGELEKVVFAEKTGKHIDEEA